MADVYKKMMMDTTFADLSIKVGKDTVQAHRALVAVRCEEIQALPKDDPKKKKLKDKGTITLKEVPGAGIINKILEFLYTDNVKFDRLDPRTIMQVMKAASRFKLDRLVFLCEAHFYNSMNMENIFHVLKAANEMQEVTIKNYCLKHALNHYNEFVTNKNGLHILGIDLFQEVVASQTEQSKFANINLRTEPASTLMADLKRLFDIMPFADVKFQIGGEEITCHKAVLHAASEKFAPILRDSSAPVALAKPSNPAFKSMLRYLYYGCVDVQPLPACELMAFTKTYELNELQKVCEGKIRSSINTDTALAILEVAYLPEIAHKQDLVEELKSKAFPFILAHLKQVDLGPLRGMHPSIAQDLLFKIQEHQRKNRSARR